MQVTEKRVAVKLNEGHCSSCSICSALCPFEAIKKNSETGKTFLEIEKCQVCGLCYSTCPAGAIDIAYYDFDSLVRYLEKAKKKYNSHTLVIMCKGSTPDFAGIEKLFGVTKFIPLSVPCVGRIPESVFLKAITMGIKRIGVLACDDNYCRFEKGSAIARRKIPALNLMLEQFGYGKEFIDLKQSSFKVKADRDKCIRCGNCAFYCPHDAVKLVSPEAASFDLDSCQGCGLCVALCPAMALVLENRERERVSALISRLSSEMTKPKILVFRCQWAALPALDEGFDSNIRAIDLPCAASIDPLDILEAFRNDVDGILVAACPEEDCKSKRGSKEAQRAVMTFKKRLSQTGFEDRLHFCFAAPRYPETLTEELRQFKEKIAASHLKEGKK